MQTSNELMFADLVPIGSSESHTINGSRITENRSHGFNGGETVTGNPEI